ncbi:hypothetical protein ABMC89_08445 [Sulfitobacter sp. HNIBRBA3233]|uniref:hypothetical protein n=1 Tax=Sulfitobacter marinivivus TaxID=3158558 RepID=UPI0032E0522C
MAKIEIPQQELGVVRVFAISKPIPDMSRQIASGGKSAVASDLLGHGVDERDIELFAISDLAGMGLAAYLAEGYGIPREALGADRGRLDGLDGYVLLLHSSVARDGAVTVTPDPALTLIGTYAEPTRSRAAAPIRTEAARPHSAETATPTRPVKSRLGSVLGLVMLAIVLLVLWLVLT